MKIDDLKNFSWIEYSLTDSLEYDYLYGSIEILCCLEEKDELIEINVGSSQVFLLQIEDWDSMYNIADSISGDVLYVMETLGQAIDNDDIYGKLLIIDEMFLKDSFESFEVRIMFLEKIIKKVSLLGVECVAFMNEAICKNQSEDVKASYLNEYLSLGFKPLVNKDYQHICLFKDLTYY
ncbi:hypothetical protein ACINLE_04645 [Bacillus sp. z60-18]